MLTWFNSPGDIYNHGCWTFFVVIDETLATPGKDWSERIKFFWVLSYHLHYLHSICYSIQPFGCISLPPSHPCIYLLYILYYITYGDISVFIPRSFHLTIASHWYAYIQSFRSIHDVSMYYLRPLAQMGVGVGFPNLRLRNISEIIFALSIWLLLKSSVKKDHKL